MRRPTGSTRGGLARGRQKGGFKTAFEAEIVTEIEALVGTGAVDEWDFEAIETAVRRKAMRVAARAVEQRLNADTSDHAGPMSSCACGQPARYAGRRGKNFESVLVSARPGAGLGRWVAISGRAAHGRAGGRYGQLRGGPRVAP
ncbi:MAG: hypothetical protein JRF55_18290 [Deltaproteobacteria bacterium]|nr:hypothetical protein [Deltaproteobacteria bacterium]